QVWEWLLHGAPVGEVIERLAALYDADRGHIETAVSAFIRDMELQRLIIASERECNGLPAIEAAASQTPFAAPVLRTFEDVQTFVAARPIVRTSRLEPASINVVGEIYPDEAIVLNLGRGLYYSLP